MKPILSIAIPVHNGENFLRQTLDSIIPQLTHNVELVIINNASTDKTERIVNEYHNDNLRYIRLSSAVELDINIKNCIYHSYGEFIWFIGDDDLILPGGVNYVLDFLKIYEYKLDYIFLNCIRYNRDLSKIISDTAIFSDFSNGPINYKDLTNYIGLNIAFTPTTLIKKSTWVDDSSDIYLGTGWYTLLNIIKNSQKWRNFVISKSIVIFRDGSNRNSQNGKFLKMINILIYNLYNLKHNKPSQEIDYLIKQIANKSIFYSVMSAKLHGYKLDFFMLKIYIKLIKFNILYTVISISALLIPSFVYKILFKNRFIIKKICY